jgi:hypothetical protein
MKIIQFLGGLGNQMFQYALYKALQKKFPNVKADLHGYQDYTLHNGFELEKIFNIKLNKISPFTKNLYNKHNRKWIYRKLRRLFNLKNAYQEEQSLFAYDPSILTDPKPRYYWGYWQNLRYFETIEEELKSDFKFKNTLTGANQQTLAHIKQTESIAIHVRRGDYLKDPLLGGLCGPDYYQAAINYIHTKVGSPEFFVFSDDIAWCQEHLRLPQAEFISWNKGPESYIDMQLMSACKHNIIANSSFSWWAAWLNPNESKIVIYPKKWVNDNQCLESMSTPENWTAL